MATNFPSSLDAFTNPTATDTLDSPPHDQQHANINDAVEALEAKVGVNSSAVTSSLDYRVTALEGAGAGMETSATPPASPSDGDLWYDTDDGRTYVYYDDGTSAQWVEFGAPAVAHGKILQVVSTTKTDTFTTSASSFTDITGMSVSITPSSTSSKVLVIASLQCNGDAAAEIGAVQLVRGSTAICVGDTASSRTRVSAAPYNASSGAIVPVSINYLDSPSTTSAVTYKLQGFTYGAATFFVNRSDTDADSTTYGRAASTITVMEVSA